MRISNCLKMPQNSLGPCGINLFGQYSKKMAWVFKVQLKDRFIQNNPFLKLWVTDQKCLQKILRSGLSGLDFQRRLLRLHPPPATGREGKRQELQGLAALPLRRERRLTSRKNTPGKLPTFPPTLCPRPRFPLERPLQSWLATLWAFDAHRFWVGEARGHGAADVIKLPLTFAHIQLFKPMLVWSYFLCGPFTVILQFKESVI